MVAFLQDSFFLRFYFSRIRQFSDLDVFPLDNAAAFELYIITKYILQYI